jgi:hypothetical protein
LITADPVPAIVGLAYDAINLMGGNIDWVALPLVMEMLGVERIEEFVRLMRFVIVSERS